MSSTKSVRVRGQVVWVCDNSHDVVVAHMVEAAERRYGDRGPAWLAPAVADWRVVASIGDLALDIPDDWPEPRYEAVARLVEAAGDRVRQHGDLRPRDLVGWSVLPGVDVSGGFLRYDRLPVSALLDVVDGVQAMVEARLPGVPPGATWWFLGCRGGRTTIPRRSPPDTLPTLRG